VDHFLVGQVDFRAKDFTTTGAPRKLGGCRAGDGHVTSIFVRLTSSSSELWERTSSGGIATVSSAIEAVEVSGDERWSGSVTLVQ